MVVVHSDSKTIDDPAFVATAQQIISGIRANPGLKW